jgi:hypothetical protein
MNRRGFLALLLGLAVISACAAGIATNRYTISLKNQKGRFEQFLAVRKGRLVLGGSTFGSVSDNQDAADRWYILGTRIKSSVGGGYLAYDPSAKTSEVFLAPRPGEGTEWVVRVVNGREGQRGAIQAATGRMKGCYLGVEEVQEPPKDGTSPPATVHRLVLSKDPPRRLEAERIYAHK